jgi:hypothetical protein
MILGLSFADSAVEINRAGIVHMSVDISNGQKTMINDKDAFEFITQLENPTDVMANMLVPHLYSCQHNIVAHDYITISKRNNLNYTFNHLNWLVYIYEDFNVHNRNWSQPAIETKHKALYFNYLNTWLDERSRKYVERRILQRKSAKNKFTLNWIKRIFRQIFPKLLFFYISGFLPGHRLVRLSSLESILTKFNK